MRIRLVFQCCIATCVLLFPDAPVRLKRAVAWFSQLLPIRMLSLSAYVSPRLVAFQPVCATAATFGLFVVLIGVLVPTHPPTWVCGWFQVGTPNVPLPLAWLATHTH